MSGPQKNGNSPVAPALFTTLSLPGFEVCWAGENPRAEGFAFGSEDGRLLFMTESGLALDEKLDASPSSEAINAVAHSGGWIAVATRCEIKFWRPDPTNAKNDKWAELPYGAHDLTISPRGFFVAALGHNGVMAIKPTEERAQTVHMLIEKDLRTVFYRVIVLQDTDGSEVLVTANRHDGIVFSKVRWESAANQTFRTMTFDGLDVVDLCPLGQTAGTLAYAALGRDRTIVLSRDALHDQRPATVKYNTLKGNGYRIFSTGGDLFVLTSHAIYGLIGLVSEFLSGKTQKELYVPIFVFPMTAVDAYLHKDKWILAVMPNNEILRLDLAAVRANVPQSLAGGEIEESLPLDFTPTWREVGLAELVATR
jgi:hypothetical protein